MSFLNRLFIRDRREYKFSKYFNHFWSLEFAALRTPVNTFRSSPYDQADTRIGLKAAADQARWQACNQLE